MATVLATWELGAGFGHLVELRQLLGPLVERGHDVYGALRDLSAAVHVLGGLEVKFLQAPIRWDRPGERVSASVAYAHMLTMVGFTDGELLPLANAWRAIMERLAPELVVFDHSPIALLSSIGLPVKRVIIGNGFFVPPDQQPLGILLPGAAPMSAILQTERYVLATVNEVLAAWGQPPLDYLGRLYGMADETMLLTIPELDPFGPRANTQYEGIWTDMGGVNPCWPSSENNAGDARRLFGYLKPFATLPKLLELIAASKLRALLFIPGISRPVRDRFDGTNVRISSEPVNLDAACEQCDLAVTSGTGNTVTRLFLAGKPALHLPQVLERELISRRVEALGAGLIADPDRADQVERQWRRLLTDEGLAAAARRYARPVDSTASVARAVERVTALLASPASSG